MLQLVKLTNYLADKDVFSDYYRRKLSRRLLGQRSASEDLEKVGKA